MDQVTVKKGVTPFGGRTLYVSRRGLDRGRPAVIVHAPMREPDDQHPDDTSTLFYYADEVVDVEEGRQV